MLNTFQENTTLKCHQKASVMLIHQFKKLLKQITQHKCKRTTLNTILKYLEDHNYKN